MVQTLAKHKEEDKEEERTLEERRLDYVHPSTGQSPQAQSTVSTPLAVVCRVADANLLDHKIHFTIPCRKPCKE